MKFFRKPVLLFVSILLLAGCFGITKETASILPDSEVRSLIKQSNFSLHLYSDWIFGTRLDQQGTVRFDLQDPIPLYFVSANGSQPPFKITNAISIIEKQLGNIFSDFQLIAEDLTVFRDLNYPNENIGNYLYSEQSFKNRHGIVGGLVISIDTAFYSNDYSKDANSMCANASVAPYSGALNVVVDQNTHTYAPETLLWANMGNRMCSWESDTVIHEIAHTFGMYEHVDDYFGSWSSVAMDMLKTLYLNPAGTPYNQLKVY